MCSKCLNSCYKKRFPLVLRDPKLFFKYLNVFLRSVITQWPKEPVQKRINGIIFEFDFDLDPLTTLARHPKLLFNNLKAGLKPVLLQIYYGVYEIRVVNAIKKLLKKGDTFIDVGANIGYMSCIAMGVVGETGQVHSFEPAPKYFKRLKNLAAANKEYKIVVNECGLGEKEGTATMDVASFVNIGWATMVPGFLRKGTEKETIEVPVYRLDRYIKERDVSNISLIKIDVEGFEFPVLKGLRGYFQNTNNRPAIICEVSPPSYKRLGYTLIQLSEYMRNYNYRAFSLFNNDVEIDITYLSETTNVLFMSSGS